MARYKPIHKGLKLLPVDFDRQVIPGSFEHALCHLVDHELDLSDFHARYHNDTEGAAAFDPAANSGDFFGPDPAQRVGPAILLAPERNPDAEAQLWQASCRATGVGSFFG